ncbi:MAG TPA: SDR family oxidoreductase [Cyclobacteriaceae bacterium]|nr:SDR family oxidoreductase [Cyclobacteriaceae bacterium]
MSKLAVITGGTKGIGRAIVEKFSSQGFDIITCARNLPALQSLKNETEKIHHNHVTILAADLADRDQINSFAELVNSSRRAVDVLVNNAGYFVSGEISTEPEGNLQQMIHANLYSAYHLTRSIVPDMKKKRSGHIFNMCSIASLDAYPNGGSYSIAKFALLGFSKCLRAELREHGIRVTAVMPGATLTDSWAGTQLPAERFMPSEDVAEMVFSSYSLTRRSVVEDIILRPQLGDL